MAYFKDLFTGFWSLILGMSVTFRYMLKKPVTVHFPFEEVSTPHFKGPIAFTTDEADGSHKCIACNACIKACPSRCMSLEIEKNPEGKRILTDFKVDHMLCSLCSICIDVCPTDALMHDSKNYHQAAVVRKEMVNDLIKPFREKGIDVNQPIKTIAQIKGKGKP